MRHLSRIGLTLLACPWMFAACSSSSSTSTTAASSSASSSSTSSGGDISVTVAPDTADVLTCTTEKLTATVTGTTNTEVTWSVMGGGSVAMDGTYTAPIQVPMPNAATVTATSAADMTKSASSTLSLFTAIAQKPVSAGGTYDSTLIHHQVASSGGHTYAVLAPADKSNDPATYKLQVAASADGGKTFGAPVVATDVGDASVDILCPSIAIDAGDPKVVYVAYLVNAGVADATSKLMKDGSGVTAALSVSSDAGATWKSYVLESHGSGWSICPDVTSPSPGEVVVETPSWSVGPGPTFTPMTVYADGAKGAGFSAGAGDMSTWRTNEAKDVTSSYKGLAYDSGSAGLESPRLFADGNGGVCLTALGGPALDDTHVFVQCSSDGGKTFGMPSDVAGMPAMGDHPHHPTGAFGKSEIDVAYWVDHGSSNEMLFARSKDAGKSFDKAISIPAYQIPSGMGRPEYPVIAWQGDVLWVAYLVSDGAGPNRFVVDKSCDGGMTWSGAVLLNGPEPNITIDYAWAGFFVDGAPYAYGAKSNGGLMNATLDVYRLAP